MSLRVQETAAQEWLEGLSRAYAMLGELLLYGLAEDASGGEDPLMPFIKAIPELASTLEPLDNDQWGATHYALFGQQVPPLAGVFLDAEDGDAVSGAKTALAMESFYATIRGEGYQIKTQRHSERADHIGLVLYALSFLTGAEADAWRDGLDQAEGIAPLRAYQTALLADTLLPALEILGLTIQSLPSRPGAPLFVEVLSLARRLCQAQADRLTGVPARLAEAPGPPDLEDADTSVADIVEFLLTPARSGWFLSQSHLRELGRQFDLPRGFGNRRLVCQNLFDEAARFKALPDLARALGQHAAVLQQRLERNSCWRDRLQATQRFVAALAIFAAKTEPDAEPNPEGAAGSVPSSAAQSDAGGASADDGAPAQRSPRAAKPETSY